MKQFFRESATAPLAFRVACVAALVGFVAHVGIITFLPLDSDLRTAIHDVLIVIEGALASAALYYAAIRSARHSRSLGLAWLLLAIATTSYMLGDAIWAFIEVVQGNSDLFPSLADAGYLPYYVIFIAGILLLPARRLEPDERIKLLLDMGVVMIASIMVYRVFLFAPIIQNATDNLTLAVTLAYPALDLVLLWGVVVVLLRQTQNYSKPLLLLAASAVCLAFADSFFNYQSISDLYQSGASFTDPIYIASLLFAALAGVLQGNLQSPAHTGFGAAVHARPSDKIPAAVRPAVTQKRAAKQLIYWLWPYLWVAISYALLIWAHGIEDTALTGEGASDFMPVAIGVGLIILLVVLRQLLTLRENAQLSLDMARLLDASSILASPNKQEQLPNLVLTQLRRLIEYDRASVWVLRGKNTPIVYQAFGQTVATLGLEIGLGDEPRLSDAIMNVLDSDLPVLMLNSAKDEALDDPIRQLLSFDDTPDSYGHVGWTESRSVVAAPLVANNRKVGMLVLS